jgi:hypothetical protein
VLLYSLDTWAEFQIHIQNDFNVYHKVPYLATASRRTTRVPR